jgi:hypothetical protein
LSDLRREGLIRVASPDKTPPPMPWHVINGTDLLAMLRRVSEGKDPDMVYTEEYVNANRDEGDDVSST